MGSLPGFEFVVPEEVVREVIEPSQSAALRAAIDSGVLAEVKIDDLETLAIFAELGAVMGRGESACLGLAVQRGWLVASDERGFFRREATARLGPGRINTAGILLTAIRAGAITVEEADAIKMELEQRKFRMKFASFRDLL